MSDMKRYTPAFETGDMHHAPDGEYVRWSDVVEVIDSDDERIMSLQSECADTDNEREQQQAEIDRLTAELATAKNENRRLDHIIGVLRYACKQAGDAAESVMEDVRIHEGRLEVFWLGEWADVDAATADYKEAVPDSEG